MPNSCIAPAISLALDLHVYVSARLMRGAGTTSVQALNISFLETHLRESSAGYRSTW